MYKSLYPEFETEIDYGIEYDGSQNQLLVVNLLFPEKEPVDTADRSIKDRID